MKTKFSKIRINTIIVIFQRLQIYFTHYRWFSSMLLYSQCHRHPGAKLLTELFSTLFKIDAHSQGCNYKGVSDPVIYSKAMYLGQHYSR